MPWDKKEHLAKQGGFKQAARVEHRVQERRAKVAEFYRAWKTQSEIALLLGVSQRLISEDLAIILAEYKTRYAKAFSEYAIAELARLNARELDHQRIHDQALDAWMRSKVPLKSTRRIAKQVPTFDVAGKQTGTSMQPVQGQVDERDGYGDPRYLAVANKALDSMREVTRLRCEMLNLYADKNLPPSGDDDSGLTVQSDDELAERFRVVSKALKA